MAISGSITKTGSTTTSISVSWSITSTASNPGAFLELTGQGAGQVLFDLMNADKPVTGSATVSGLSPNTSYTFNFGGIDKLNETGGQSYSFSTDPVPSNPPSWSDNTLAGFVATVAYSDGVSATNSPTYSVSAGSLPAGISLNTSTGAVTGTPTTAGSYSFTLRAANGDGAVTQAFSGTVAAAPSAGKWRVWTGSTWVVGPLKVWNGTAWVDSSVKVWNGSEWVTSV
jgi:hypothetical protein